MHSMCINKEEMCFMKKKLILFSPDYSGGLKYNHRKTMWPLGIQLTNNECQTLRTISTRGYGTLNTEFYVVSIENRTITVKRKNGFTVFNSKPFQINDITNRKGE